MEAELQLIEKVELRITLASSEQKFQANLNTFLTPLLLKLGSPYEQVKTKVRLFIGHLMIRINSYPDLTLPLDKLLEQVAQADLDGSVKLYSYLFMSKGLERILNFEIIIGYIGKIVEILALEVTKANQLILARSFNILIRLIDKFSDKQLRNFANEFSSLYKTSEAFTETYLKLDQDPRRLDFLFDKFTKLLLFTGGNVVPGLCAEDVKFLTDSAGIRYSAQYFKNVKLKVMLFVNILNVQNQVLSQNLYVYCYLLFAGGNANSTIKDIAVNLLRRIDATELVGLEKLLQLATDYYLGNGRNSVSSEIQELIISKIFIKSELILDSDQHSLIAISKNGFASTNSKLAKAAILFTKYVAVNNHSASKTFNRDLAEILFAAIHSDGWPKQTEGNSTDRRLQYETLTDLLIGDASLLLENDFKYIKFLFDSLNGEVADNVIIIQDSLTKLINDLGTEYRKLPDNKDLSSKLKLFFKPYLAINNTIDEDGDVNMGISLATSSSRFLALKFVNSLFNYQDVEARFLDLYGSWASNRYDVIEVGNKGLNPYWFKLSSGNQDLQFPRFDELVNQLTVEIEYYKNNSDCVLPRVLKNAFDYLFKILVMEIVGSKIPVDEDWDFIVEKSVEIDDKIRNSLISYFNKLTDQQEDSLLLFINLLVSELLSYKSLEAENDFNAIYENIKKFGSLFNLVLSFCNGTVRSKVANSENIQILLSIITTENKTFYGRLIQDSIINLANVVKYIVGDISIEDGKISFGDRSIEVLSFVEHPQNDLVTCRLTILSTLIGNSHVGSVLSIFATKLYDCLKDNHDNKRWKHYEALLFGINELSKFGTLKDTAVTEKIEQLIVNKVKKYDEKSAITLAYLSLVNITKTNEWFEIIYETHSSKQNEYLFASGEAITILASGWDSKILKRLEGNNTHQDLIVKHDYLKPIFKKVLKGCANSKPLLRKACCLWLLSLVQYLGQDPIIVASAKEIQIAFMRYLVDSDNLIQESAATGLSLIYELGNNDLKESLVKGLIKSFTNSTSSTNLRAGTITEETELFEPGILKTPDGSISTYKDILSLASEVGDPSLVYKFMSLTKSNALWSSRRGIAFGLGSIMSKANLEKQLQSNDELTKRLIVKLYRYKFDPNENVSRSMTEIWNILIPNSKVVEQNYNIIIKELLTGFDNREWRVRQASAMAIIDLLQVCKLEKYEHDLEAIWTMAFRAMDDIKESVREAGNSLTKYLSNSLILSLEANSNPQKYYGILEKLIDILLSTKGILSGVEEVQNYSISIILKLCMKSGKAIKPFAPKLIEEFLVLMSTIEPQIANYLALNADKYKLKSSDIDAQRIISVGSSPIMEAVERLLDLLDEDSKIVNSIVSAIKKSIGLPSKVAASKVIVSLVTRHRLLLNRNNSTKLLNACVLQLNNRNETVTIAFANSIGYLCRVVKITEVVSYGEYLKQKYFETKSDSQRKLAAIGSSSVAKFSNDMFNSVATVFLPFAYVARQDPEKDIADKFESVWVENTGGNSAVKLYIDEICTLVSEQLQSQHYLIRQVAAKAIAAACKLLGQTDDSIVGLSDDLISKLFSILIESCKGRTWTGKAVVLNGLVTFASNFKSHIKDQEQYSKIEKTILTESRKNNKEYHKEAVKSLSFFVKNFPSPELYHQEIDILLPFFSEEATEDSDQEEEEPTKTTFSQRETTLVLALECLADSFALQKEGSESLINLEFVHFYFQKAIPQGFELESVSITWKTKIAVCTNSSKIFDIIGKADGQNFDGSCFETFVKVILANCLTDDIENVRIQSVKTLSKLAVLLPNLQQGNKLQLQIIEALNSANSKDSSTIVKAEIEKALSSK